MKRIYSFIGVGAALCSLVTVVSAANVPTKAPEAIKDELTLASQYAYQDLETASPEQKEKILKARETIIFSKEWVADGHTCFVEDSTGEIVRVLPTFSEVFPEDWDVPVHPTTAFSSTETDATHQNVEEDEYSITPLDSTSWVRVDEFNYYLKKASSSANAEPFVTFIVDPYEIGITIRTRVRSLTSSATCNIGYSDEATGEPLSHAIELSLGESCIITDVGNVELGIRASTYSTPGWSTLAVDGANRKYDVRKGQ